MWSLFFPTSISWRVKITWLPWQMNTSWRLWPVPRSLGYNEVGSWWCGISPMASRINMESFDVESPCNFLLWVDNLISSSPQVRDVELETVSTISRGTFLNKEPRTYMEPLQRSWDCVLQAHFWVAGFCHCGINKRQWDAHTCCHSFSGEENLNGKDSTEDSKMEGAGCEGNL